MTMAYHVYDSIYCKVMTIVVYDMQSKDTKAQCILWRKLNAVVERKGLGTPAFKGFMQLLPYNFQANMQVPLLPLQGLLQGSMITCKHSSSPRCIMPFYKEVHMASIWTKMNCICVGLVNLGTLSKLLLQLPSTPQALVFLLEYCTWKVKKCLDQLNAK